MNFLEGKDEQHLRSRLNCAGLSKSEIGVIVWLLRSCLINKVIAEKLCVAEKTIKFHLGNAFKKMSSYSKQKITTRATLVSYCWSHDFIRDLPLKPKVQSSPEKYETPSLPPVVESLPKGEQNV